MMMEPKIRFKGFSGEWKTQQIGDIATFSKGKGYSKADLCSEGNPIILYGSMYTNYSSVIDNVITFAPIYDGATFSKGNEVIIPASGETPEDIAIASAVKQKDVILGGDINIVNFDKEFEPAFMALTISNGKTHYELSRYAQGKTIVHLHNTEIAKGTISAPSLPEQRALATFFTSLDNQISAAEKRLASLKQVKAASLQAMFPQEGETTPKLRFKGWEGEWKKVKLGEVFELRNGYTPSKAVDAFWTNGTIPWFRMEDIRDKGGLLKDAYQKITPEAVKGGGLFEANSILLATTATIGVHAMLIADSLANQRFTNLSIRKSLADKYLPMFVYYAFFGIDEWCLKNTNTGGLLSVDINELCKLPFLTPSLTEQRQIASYFTSLDRQISAQSSKISKLKQIKSACLDQMFV